MKRKIKINVRKEMKEREKGKDNNIVRTVCIHALSTGSFDLSQDFEGFMSLYHLTTSRVLTFPKSLLLQNLSTE